MQAAAPPAGSAAVAGLIAALAIAACEIDGGRAEADAVILAGGSAERGAEVIEAIGCGACHTIPGIRRASATVGPSLSGFARRSFIAGRLPNSPGNLVRWILNPHSVEPGTAMPRLGLSRQQATDAAAYLYTLR